MHTHKTFFYRDWTPLHKTLVYSLVRLYFKQYIVYIIEYVDFPGGVLINSVLESFLQMPLFKQQYLSSRRSLSVYLGLQKGEKKTFKSALTEAGCLQAL